MEVMALPTRETLTFFDEVVPWLTDQNVKENGVIFTFKKDTPSSVFELLENIKSNLTFKVLEYSKENDSLQN